MGTEEKKEVPSVIAYVCTTKQAMKGVKIGKAGEHVTMLIFPSNARLHQRRMLMHEKACRSFANRNLPAVHQYEKDVKYDGHEYDVYYAATEGVTVEIPKMVKAILSETASFSFEMIKE